jgi:uncharacterized protein (TIGR03086 family)
MRGVLLPAHDAGMTESHTPDAAVSIDELIALGRDREAVEAATRRAATIQAGCPMDGVQQLDEIIPLLEGLVDGISPDELDNATPCAGFTVTGVLEHMIGGATAFAPAFRGEPAAADSEDTTQERWRRAMAELVGAVHAPGAQERTISTPFGEMPGSAFARYVAFDGLVHGWDLAVATGQRYTPPSDLVADVDDFARDLLKPEMRDGDTFDAETQAPPGATPLERLVAFSGRQLTDKNTETPT